MSKYKQFFTNHALLKERCVEICRLFHKNDPDLYPDILEEDLLFVFDERQTITVINSELITVIVFLSSKTKSKSSSRISG